MSLNNCSSEPSTSVSYAETRPGNGQNWPFYRKVTGSEEGSKTWYFIRQIKIKREASLLIIVCSLANNYRMFKTSDCSLDMNYRSTKDCVN